MAGRTLKRTVLLGGQVYPAGTAETPALSKALPHDSAWDGKKPVSEAPKKAPSKPASSAE